MTMLLRRRAGGALLLLLAAWLLAFAGAPALAQSAAEEQVQRQQTQPLNNAPVWREVRSGEPAFTTVRGPETEVLIQSQGNTWRTVRNGPITFYGGILLLVVPTAIALFFLVKGALKVHGTPTGRSMQRFSAFERFVHWGTAITFVVLAVTGLAILFGRHVLAPVFGNDFLAVLLLAGKNVHNYLGPVFIVFTLLMIVAFARDNIWQACDALWIRKAGGLATGEHVPSGRFNFGEKSWFWIGVTFLGLVVAASGLVMDFPNFGQTRATMQWANVIHATASILFIALSLGHIYMGTIGVEGAYQSMKTGVVDESWAKEHHEFWYNDVKTGKPGNG